MAGHGNPTHSLGQYTDKEQGDQHGLKGAERSVPALFQGAQPTQIEQMVENKQCKRPNSQPFINEDILHFHCRFKRGRGCAASCFASLL